MASRKTEPTAAKIDRLIRVVLDDALNAGTGFADRLEALKVVKGFKIDIEGEASGGEMNRMRDAIQNADSGDE